MKILIFFAAWLLIELTERIIKAVFRKETAIPHIIDDASFF